MIVVRQALSILKPVINLHRPYPYFMGLLFDLLISKIPATLFNPKRTFLFKMCSYNCLLRLATFVYLHALYENLAENTRV